MWCTQHGGMRTKLWSPARTPCVLPCFAIFQPSSSFRLILADETERASKWARMKVRGPIVRLHPRSYLLYNSIWKHGVACLKQRAVVKQKRCCNIPKTRQSPHNFNSYLKLCRQQLKCSNMLAEHWGETSRTPQWGVSSWDFYTFVPFHQTYVVQTHNGGEGLPPPLQLQTQCKISRPET